MKLKDVIEKYGNIEVNEDKLVEVLELRINNIIGCGDVYYTTKLAGYGYEVIDYEWENDLTDKALRQQHNVFLKREDAKNRCDILNKMLELSVDCIPNWGKQNERKYAIIYNHAEKGGKVFVANYLNEQHGNAIYFKSEEDAQSIIDKFGEDEIAYYLFGVTK